MAAADQVHVLRAIVEIQQAAFTRDLTVSAVMQLIAECARDVTQATGAVIEVIDGDQLEYAHATGSLAGTEGLRLAMEGSLFGLAAMSGEIQISDDAATDRRVDKQAAAAVGAASMAVVPLLAHGRVVAVLKVISDQKKDFGQREQEILDTLAEFAGTVLDQTKAMQERRLRHETYRLIAEASADAIIQVSLEGRIMWASPAAEEILGYPPEALVGLPAQELIAQESRNRYVQRMQEAVATRADTRWQFPTVRPDGTTVWVDSAGRFAQDERGRPLYRIVRIRDVTAERLAKEELSRSETRFRLAMQNAPIGMCLIRPDGTFAQVNDALCELLGRPANVLMASSWQELTHADDLDVDLGFMQQVLGGEIDRYRLIKRYLRPDGEVVWGDLSVSCVRDSDAVVRHFISQIVDVSVAMQEQQRAAETIDRFERLVAVGSDIIAELDSDGRFRWVSPNTDALLGVAPPDVLAAHPADFVPADQRQAVRTALSEAMTAGQSGHMEFSLQHADGRILRAEAVVEPANDRHIIRMRDVTDQHQTREHLRQLAITDPLAGVLSRGEFERRVDALLNHAPRAGSRTFLAVMLVAAKTEPVPEEIVTGVARRVRRALREADSVAHLGGGMLTLMLPGITTSTAAREVLVRLVQAVASPHPMGSEVVRPGVNVGATEMHEDEWLEDVFARAESALDVARSSGINRVHLMEPDVEPAPGQLIQFRSREDW